MNWAKGIFKGCKQRVLYFFLRAKKAWVYTPVFVDTINEKLFICSRYNKNIVYLCMYSCRYVRFYIMYYVMYILQLESLRSHLLLRMWPAYFFYFSSFRLAPKHHSVIFWYHKKLIAQEWGYQLIKENFLQIRLVVSEIISYL